MNSKNELTTAGRSGTLTVAGLASLPAASLDNVTVNGTGLSSGEAEVYADGSWARAEATLMAWQGSWQGSNHNIVLTGEEGQLGESHAGELKRESAQARAERIIAEELKRQGWSEEQLRQRRKSDPVKLALAARLRRETILTVGWIAKRLAMGTRQSVATRLQERKKTPKKRQN